MLKQVQKRWDEPSLHCNTNNEQKSFVLDYLSSIRLTEDDPSECSALVTLKRRQLASLLCKRTNFIFDYIRNSGRTGIGSSTSEAFMSSSEYATYVYGFLAGDADVEQLRVLQTRCSLDTLTYSSNDVKAIIVDLLTKEVANLPQENEAGFIQHLLAPLLFSSVPYARCWSRHIGVAEMRKIFESALKSSSDLKRYGAAGSANRFIEGERILKALDRDQAMAFGQCSLPFPTALRPKLWKLILLTAEFSDHAKGGKFTRPNDLPKYSVVKEDLARRKLTMDVVLELDAKQTIATNEDVFVFEVSACRLTSLLYRAGLLYSQRDRHTREEDTWNIQLFPVAGISRFAAPLCFLCAQDGEEELYHVFEALYFTLFRPSLIEVNTEPYGLLHLLAIFESLIKETCMSVYCHLLHTLKFPPSHLGVEMLQTCLTDHVGIGGWFTLMDGVLSWGREGVLLFPCFMAACLWRQRDAIMQAKTRSRVVSLMAEAAATFRENDAQLSEHLIKEEDGSCLGMGDVDTTGHGEEEEEEALRGGRNNNASPGIWPLLRDFLLHSSVV